METVKMNDCAARQKERIEAYRNALDQKAGRHETDKTGKRNDH